MLAEEGFAYDASFLPIDKDGKKPKRVAHQVDTRRQGDLGISVFDDSISASACCRSRAATIFARLPYTLMRHAVKDWHKRHDDPFVFYFHVWELDPEQPRISAASKYNRIRHYRKLDKMEWILHENLALVRLHGHRRPSRPERRTHRHWRRRPPRLSRRIEITSRNARRSDAGLDRHSVLQRTGIAAVSRKHAASVEQRI